MPLCSGKSPIKGLYGKIEQNKIYEKRQQKQEEKEKDFVLKIAFNSQTHKEPFMSKSYFL